LAPWAPLLLAIWAGKWDGRLQLATEVRAGEGPLQAAQAPRAGVAVVATPSFLLRWSEPGLRFQIDYSARGFWRQPNELGHQRPLLLHVLHLALIDRVSPLFDVNAEAQASVGEADYSVLPTLFASPQSSLPDVAKILSLTAGLGMSWEPSRLWLIEVAGGAEHRQTLGAFSTTPDASEMTPGLRLPRQTSVRQSSMVGLRPSRRALVGLSLTGAFAQYDSAPAPKISLLAVSPQGYWRYKISRETELRGAFGAALSSRWEKTSADGLTIGPTFSLMAESHFARVEGQTWDVGGGLSEESQLDPVLAVAIPRGSALLHVWWRGPPRWQAGIEGSFITSLSRTPLVGLPDETAFNLSLPIRYRVSLHGIWEWGVRWADRAPHWDAPEFRFHQRQVWLYCSLLAETSNLLE
jgi:hypothetical protein